MPFNCHLIGQFGGQSHGNLAGRLEDIFMSLTQ
jgi:hypothetical protein